MDFTEDIAELMRSGQTHPAHDSGNGGRGTPASYDEYARRPHNIFDVSLSQSANPAHSNHFGHHLSQHYPVSVPSSSHSHMRSTSSQRGSDSPYVPYASQNESIFAHTLPLPSPLPPLNINGHLPPAHDDLMPSSYQPSLSGNIDFRSGSPSDTQSRSRSRSISKPSAVGSLPTRSRLPKKRGSMSGIERPHISLNRPLPSAITIPSNDSSRPDTACSSAPISSHGMWPPTHGFSLPTPDGMSTHSFASFSNGNGNGGSGREDRTEVDVTSKQAMIANEKRRRRRESHNAVERRRRDNINEKISELATLIPECMLDPVASSANGDVVTPIGGQSHSGDEKDKEGGVIKANKGMILRKSVDYIRYLQQLVAEQASRNQLLEEQLHQHLGGSGTNSEPSLPSPLSEGAGELNGALHVFSDDMLQGIDEIGMVDVLGSMGSDATLAKSASLATLHETVKDAQEDFQMEDSSPSESAGSPEQVAGASREEERGRTRRRSQIDIKVEV